MTEKPPIAIEQIRRRHRSYGIYDECGHEHAEGDPGVVEVDDVGLVCKAGLQYEVCFACHTDDGEVCEWTPEEQAWPCDTKKVLKVLDALRGLE